MLIGGRERGTCVCSSEGNGVCLGRVKSPGWQKDLGDEPGGVLGPGHHRL